MERFRRLGWEEGGGGGVINNFFLLSEKVLDFRGGGVVRWVGVGGVEEVFT